MSKKGVAQTTKGPPCIRCGSTNTGSRGKNWYCKDCGAFWRKLPDGEWVLDSTGLWEEEKHCYTCIDCGKRYLPEIRISSFGSAITFPLTFET